jgi:predicted nucleic acid-binding protein
MISVLDVSGAIQIILQKEKHALFNDKIKESSWVIAPDLYVSELSNVLWKYYKASVITHEESIQFVEDGINLIDDFIDARDLWKEALGEGIRNNHSIYDMYYSVLARRNDALLITNDGPLADICKKLNIPFCYE